MIRKRESSYIFWGSLLFLFLLLEVLSLKSNAQIIISPQLRDRAEFRNGYSSLRPKSNQSSAIVSQRARLMLDLKKKRLLFHLSMQDVRLWGQDASTISINDGGRFELHEAWSEVILSDKNDSSFKKPLLDYFAFKIGRQELVYDDEQLLGNLDWLAQGRRHDAIVWKLRQAGWKLDFGAAFNQNTDAINYNGTYYTPANVSATIKDSKGNLVNTPAGFIPLIGPGGVSSKTGTPSFTNPPGTNGLTQNYKALEFIHLTHPIGKSKISALFLSDQFSRYILDSVKNAAGTDAAYVYGRHFNQTGVNTRYTAGATFSPDSGPDSKQKLLVNIAAYYQGGHDRDGLRLSAYLAKFSVGHKIGSYNITAGWDYLSGNNANSTSSTNHRFDPLYGTPHKFHGNMDFFYASSGSPSGGLSNPYLKLRYTSSNTRFSAELADQLFYLSNIQKDSNGQPINSFLGNELDFTSLYKLNNMTTIELGVSYMSATHSMEYAKNLSPGTASLTPFWAYLQVNIKPQLLNLK